MSFQPLEKDIMELQNAMSNGEIDSVKLTEFYLDRINLYDKKGPMLNSMVTVNSDALDTARKLQEERKTTGKRSELHGIPIVLKDNFNTKDMPTTASSVLLAENRPSIDAFVVEKLRDAGAIILGKTNLSEFACHGFTDGTLIGQTLNPYDLTRTPGGSSGGSGVAIAANFAVAGFGTDTANSVRSPASATNLVGFRPTTGLFSRDGIIPVSNTQDTAGTLTRTVSDAAILFDICSGYDRNDIKTSMQVGRVPLSYIKHLKSDGLRGKRFGLLTNNCDCEEGVQEIIEKAINLMHDNGATIVPIDMQELNIARIGEECDVQYYEFKEQLNAYFSKMDLCPIKDFQCLVDSQKLYPVIQEFMRECSLVENPDKIDDYKNRLIRIQNKRLFVYNVMADKMLDAFIYPHQKILVQHIGLKSQVGRNGILASIMGFPAITVPAGFSTPSVNAPIGVPVGIEFMARPWSEGLLFEVAFGFEQVSNKRKLPPTTP